MSETLDEGLFADHFERQLVLAQQSTKQQSGQTQSQPKLPDQKPQQASKQPQTVQQPRIQLKQQLKQQTPQQSQLQKPIDYNNKSKKFRFNGDEPDDPLIVPPLFDKAPANEKEAHTSMMMSWYMAGYHTGYYNAMKHLKK